MIMFHSTSLSARNINPPELESTHSLDLDEIIERGTLRIIVPINFDGGQFLPRHSSPMDEQQRLARGFAESMGIKAEIIPVFTMSGMLKTLLRGEGDLIIANITITEKRKKKIAFTVPVEHVQEVVLVQADNKEIKNKKDLKGKTLLVHPSTTFWETAKALKETYPEINIVKQQTYIHDEDSLDLISDKDFDATIRDSNIAKMYLAYRDDLKVAFRLKGDKAIGWGLRPDATKLQKSLNVYLQKYKLASSHNENLFGDLDEIKKRGVLRVLLKNNSSSYFFWKGQLMGFEYEMAKAYAKSLGVKLAVVVAPENTKMLEWLREGKADLAAGFLHPSLDWKEQFITASDPYHEAKNHLVVHKNNKKIESMNDLAKTTIVVHKSSLYWKVLLELKASGVDLNLQVAPESLEIEEVLEKVAKGEYQSTLVAEHLLNIELGAGVDIRSAFALDKVYKNALAVRMENTELLLSLNNYINEKKDGKLYGRLYKKYFDNSQSISKFQKDRLKSIDGKKTLSAYDKYVKIYSKRYGFDWRLITAQMYSESRFRPNARSSAGAIGLMQVMTNTGKQLRLRKLTDPETNIHAGIKYMHWLSGKFEPELPIEDRMWFTLASYNAGLGHVLDARRLASKQGLNKNRWFGNVEKAMLLLSKRNYYSRARYGYVRGREPVGYVKKIKRLYENYLNVSHSIAKKSEAKALLTN
ncbi:MAG: Transglycosylase, Slt family [uncultured Thiotrichaceae bacterium]|uniref:Transglycosylase, Slt family n=1 Tax=uncultured Thiotrichaceae bacterium TaxID=298394 RepID=A0A6S6U398_9GAMM|nr:MAG: Transglycosylase, Slt family [uncultured Thiotrichaceae bacterium]